MIARDEGLHTDFILLYSKLNNKLPQETIYKIFKEAVEIEENFITDSLPCRLIGMNQNMMKQYIHYVADRLLMQLGYEPMYQETNPFSFMTLNSLDGKTNFFEKRVTEYQIANGNDAVKNTEITTDDDF